MTVNRANMKYCPNCGYTEADKKLHLDHHLCSAERVANSIIGKKQQVDWNAQKTKKLIASAIQSEVDAAVRAELARCIKVLEEADPLEAKGYFWEYGDSDDIAVGVQKYLVSRLSKLEKESK